MPTGSPETAALDAAPEANASPAPGGVGVARPLLLLLGTLSMFGPLSLDMYLPGLPALGDDLGVSASTAQLTLTTCMIGLGLGQLVAGPVSDRFGRRTPLLVGVGVYAVASALCAIAPSIWVLVALRLVQGAAGAAGLVIGRAVARDLTEGRTLARLLALLVVLSGVAPIVAPLLGGGLLHVTDWRGVFVVLAAIGAALFVASWRALRETLPTERRHGGGFAATVRGFGPLLADRVVLGSVLAFGVSFASLAAYISGSPYVLQDHFGVSPQVFSLLFALNSAGIMAASTISGRLVERHGPRRLLDRSLAAQFAGGVGVLVAVLAHAPLGVVLIPLFVATSSIGMVLPNASALAMAGHPRQAGSVSGLLGSTQFACGAIAAPLAGLGANPARGMAIVMAVATAAAWLARPDPRVPPAAG